MEISSRTAGLRMRNRNRNPEYILKTSLAVFVCLVLLVPSSVSVFHLPTNQDAYAQPQETAVSSVTNTPATIAGSNPSTPKLPQSLRVTDSAMGDAQLPLRASIVNNEPIGELPNASQDKGKLGEYFPIVVFHLDEKPVGFETGSTIVKHVLVGPIKSYDAADSVLSEANYWKDIPLDKKVALETDHPGLHYFIASVQFANGTSGIYSGMMEVNATGIKPSADESIQFQLGPENVASGVAKIDQSDMKASESDPVFQQIASRIICSDLSNNGFEVCEVGEEEQVLEEDDSEDSSSDDEREDGVEVRGDGGRGGTYDRNNCTGEQCEDADEETQEEEEGDYCEIDPGYCTDKNEGNGDDDNGNDDGNSGGDSDNEEGNSDNEDDGSHEEESGDGEENENANA
jgi:hypothetical protein